MTTPEFRYENKLDHIKPKDKAALLEYLEIKEKHEAELKAAAEAAAAEAAASNATPAKGKDAKKVEKKPPAKGAPVAEDKNSPQPITVEYPEDVKEQEEFLIFERKYNAKDTLGKKIGPPGSAPILPDSKKKENPWGDLGSKLKDRTKELVDKYKIIRGSPYTLAVELKLNVEIPPEPVKEDTLSE